MQEKREEIPISNPALPPNNSRALLSQRVEAHPIAPNHCWFTTQVRGIMHKWLVNVGAQKHFYDVHHLLLARIQAWNFSFCLPSSTLLESTYKSLAEPRWILSAKPQTRTLEVSFFEIQACFYSLPEELTTYVCCLHFSHQEYKHRFNPAKAHKLYFFPIVTDQNAKWVWWDLSLRLWLKSSGKIILEGKDSKELNACALSKYWQLWKASASDSLESKQWAKLLQYAGDI